MTKDKTGEKFTVVDPDEKQEKPQNPEGKQGSAREGAAATGAPPGATATQQQAIQLDDSQAIACYANFCRVTGSPEEVILDLGLNPQPFGVPAQPVKVSQRLVMNYFTAKRLLAALQMTVQRHEQAFGVLETDVQKRVRANFRTS